MSQLLSSILNNDIKRVESEMRKVLEEDNIGSLIQLKDDERSRMHFLILAEQFIKKYKMENRSLSELISLLESFGYPNDFLFNKFCSVYALIALFDWPVKFPNFMENVFNLMKSGNILGYGIFEQFIHSVRYSQEIEEKRRQELRNLLCITRDQYMAFLITEANSEIGLCCVRILAHLLTIVDYDLMFVLNTYASLNLDNIIISALEKKQDDQFYIFLEKYFHGVKPNAKIIYALDKKQGHSFLKYAIRGLFADDREFSASLLYLKSRINALFCNGVFIFATELSFSRILENIGEKYEESEISIMNLIKQFFADISKIGVQLNDLQVEKVPRELLVLLMKNMKISSDDIFVKTHNAIESGDKEIAFMHFEILSADFEGEKLLLRALDKFILSETELRNLCQSSRSVKLSVKISTKIPNFNILEAEWTEKTAEKFQYLLLFDSFISSKEIPFFLEYFQKTHKYDHCFRILIEIQKIYKREEKEFEMNVYEKCYKVINEVPIKEMDSYIEFLGLCKYFSEFSVKLHERVMKEIKDSVEWDDLKRMALVYLNVLKKNGRMAELIELLQVDEITVIRKILQIISSLSLDDSIKPRSTYLLLVLYSSSKFIDIQNDVINALCNNFDANTLLMANNDKTLIDEISKKNNLKSSMKRFLHNIRGQELAKMGKIYFCSKAQNVIKKEDKRNVFEVDLSREFFE